MRTNDAASPICPLPQSVVSVQLLCSASSMRNQSRDAAKFIEANLKRNETQNEWPTDRARRQMDRYTNEQTNRRTDERADRLNRWSCFLRLVIHQQKQQQQRRQREETQQQEEWHSLAISGANGLTKQVCVHVCDTFACVRASPWVSCCCYCYCYWAELVRISCVANATTKITVTIRRTHSCSHYLPSAREGQPQDKARHHICQAQCKSKLIRRSTEICLLYLNSYMINQWKLLFFYIIGNPRWFLWQLYAIY